MIKVKSILYTVLPLALIISSACSKVSVETSDNFEVIELPDGSIAYLNYNSAIEYDEEFSPRIVQIGGEVFLSVIADENSFVVQTDLGEITVLGTEFNVRSDVNEMAVEVEEGIVELRTKIQSDKVKRGEAAVYKKAKNEIQKGKAEFKFRLWISDLKREFKSLGKEIKSHSKEIGKESKEAGKEIKEDLKKLKIK
jgi:ferric-dicitrate binding protein FerR (iron transport regulator)